MSQIVGTWDGVFGGYECTIIVESRPTQNAGPIFIARVFRRDGDRLREQSDAKGRVAEPFGGSEEDAADHASTFLERRYGIRTALYRRQDDGRIIDVLLPPQPLPIEIEVAGYGDYGCPICEIGEPDEPLEGWIEHIEREHGYAIVADEQRANPNAFGSGDRSYRVITFRRA